MLEQEHYYVYPALGGLADVRRLFWSAPRLVVGGRIYIFLRTPFAEMDRSYYGDFQVQSSMYERRLKAVLKPQKCQKLWTPWGEEKDISTAPSPYARTGSVIVVRARPELAQWQDS
jgi:hypothetical protein